MCMMESESHMNLLNSAMLRGDALQLDLGNKVDGGSTCFRLLAATQGLASAHSAGTGKTHNNFNPCNIRCVDDIAFVSPHPSPPANDSSEVV